MIRIRCDDYMVESSSMTKEKALNRIYQIHKWINQAPQGYFNYIPTIVCSEMDNWPEIVDLLRHETAAHKISPQIHGWEHIDYSVLPKNIIKDHLSKCLDWFNNTLWYAPTIWATPWGAWNQKIEEVAQEFHLTVETTAPTMSIGNCIELAKSNGVEQLRYGNPLVLMHWWEKGLKLLRLTEIVRYGSYEAAVRERADLFK